MRHFSITMDGKTYELDVEETGRGGQAVRGTAPRMGSGAPAPRAAAPVHAAPAPAAAAPAAPAPAAMPAGGGAGVKTPISGKMVAINVKIGDKVKKDDLIGVVESMKMEYQIYADRDGTVASIVVSVGDRVNMNQVVATLS